MMETIIIGIDPGASGAIAFICKGGFARVEDCPDSPAGMAHLIQPGMWRYAHAYIERVAARPGQGVTSMFKFGQNFGTWLGILAANDIPMTMVTPQEWKKAMRLLKSDKDASRMRAMELYPALAYDLGRKKDDGRAEALLIAHYGRKIEDFIK